MLKKKFVLLVALLATTSTMTAPATHAASMPTRIISLSPSATEDLFAIGAGKNVIAVDSLSNYPASAPTTKLDAFTPNVEAIAKYKPDLVVLQSSATKAVSVKAALEKLKIKVFFEVTPSDLNGVYAEITALGKATGTSSGSTKVVTAMKAKIAKAISLGKRSTPLPIFHEVDNTLYSATSSTFIGHVYAAFNTTNVADAADTADSYGYPQLTNEYLLKSNPSVIFLGDEEPKAKVLARAGWNAIDAVSKSHVIELPADIPSRWGPRLADFYQFVANTLIAIK
jgi:iron complex transport system substrate-binding protein